MPVVISDTSPLNYLVLIDEAEVLRHLYGQVLVPAAVIAELQQAATPATVRHWVSHPPPWLEIVPRGTVGARGLGLELLGEGEREAIALALDRRADMLVMDDREGVDEARRLGLTVTGTLGVLQRAAERRLVHLSTVIKRLQSTNFRANPEVIRALLQQDASRKE